MDKKAQTKAKILDAALQEFAANGFNLASTNVIAFQAGVSKGTIFKYYPAKTALFHAVFEQELVRMIDAVDAVDLSAYSDPFEKITSMLLWKAQYAALHPEATKLLSEGISNPPSPLSDSIAVRLAGLGKYSVDRLFDDLPTSRLIDGLTKTDVKRILEIALAGLQAIYVTGHPEFPFSETAKEECMRYLKIVYRGMEKQ